MDILNRQISTLFARAIDRRIEAVIKVDQTNEDVVAQELEEYVATDRIREGFIQVLERYLETPNQPHEGIGIWISGFFGSGKSSFAKILGYILENRPILGHPAAERFLQRLSGVSSEKLNLLVHHINTHIPTSAVIFDVSTDASVKTGPERITALMYRALLRELGYSQDFNIAELEINLEAEDQLADFERRYEAAYGNPWNHGRIRVAVAIGQASRVAHEMDPVTYPTADSWATGLERVEIDTNPNMFADRVFDLMWRRRGGRSIVFVIDEVGQYVARSTDKMLDLQGVVQALGAKGRGRAWVTVTSQERLEEIISPLDQTRIELGRLRDRFPLRVDLVVADIREVASVRVLAKQGDAWPELEELYDSVEDRLTTCTQLDGTARYPGLSRQEFARLYPFLPYQIDLIIEIISGLRLQSGGNTHTGGSSRTIIQLAQQVLVNDRVGLGKQNVGPLVTLDIIYDLIDQFVTPERRYDIELISRDFPPGEHPQVGKVAKVLCLLEHVKNVDRTPKTISAVLHPSVSASTLIHAVEAALDLLKTHQWVEESEHGWQLLSPQGKKWAQERNNVATPKAYQYTRYTAELLEEVLRTVRDYCHLGHRTFRPTFQYANDVLGTIGDIVVEMSLVDPSRWEAERKDTAERSHENGEAVFWVAPVQRTFYDTLDEYHRSKEMLARSNSASQPTDLDAQIDQENRRMVRTAADARARLVEALVAGDLYFGGYRHEALTLSEHLPELLQRLFAEIVPILYPNFNLAAVPVKETDIPRIIDDRALVNLPAVYYVGTNGLGLVVKEGRQFKPNPDASLAAEILSYIKRSYRPNERVYGEALLDHFRGFGYGWEPEPVRLVTALLLRAGKIEITAGGQRIQSHTDTGAREVFATLPAFRSASFSPKTGGVTWEDVVNAAAAAMDIFGGDEMPMHDAGLAAEALKVIYEQERIKASDVQSKLYQAGLPGADAISDYMRIFEQTVKNSTDDRLLTFLAELPQIREGHDLVVRMRKELVPMTIDSVRAAREAVRVARPSLPDRPDTPAVLPIMERLEQNLRSPRWYLALADIKTDHAQVVKAYRAIYTQVAKVRTEHYKRAVESVKGHPKWLQLSSTHQDRVLAPLLSRAAHPRDLNGPNLPTVPSIREMEAETEAVEALRSQAIYEVARLASAGEAPKLHRIRVSTFVQGAVEDPEALEEVLGRLRDECMKILGSGGKVILE